MKTKLNIKKIAFAVASFAAIGLIASSAMVSAYQGDPTKQGPNYDADLHNLKVAAFDSGDYAVWHDLMEQHGNSGRVLEVVNEDNFDIFVEAHNAALSGDMERSAELRAELGLNNGAGPRDGTGHKGMNGARQGQGKRMGGQGQQLGDHANFIDADNDGSCDNLGTNLGMNSAKMQGMGRQ